MADDHEVHVSLVKELLAIKDGMLSVPFISQIEAKTYLNICAPIDSIILLI